MICKTSTKEHRSDRTKEKVTNREKTQRDPKNDRPVYNFEKTSIFIRRRIFLPKFSMLFENNVFFLYTEKHTREGHCILATLFQPRETYKSDFVF